MVVTQGARKTGLRASDSAFPRLFLTTYRRFAPMYDMKNMNKLKKLGELAPDAWKGFLAFDEAAF